ncbi:MAG: ATP-binding protein [Candidatus Paceibacterota bacterium]|jgi:hypothetical protein
MNSELNLLKYNPHWEKQFQYPYPKKRGIFDILLNTISRRQIIEIVGLRRTGKTTILFQLINSLLNKNVNPYSILYFTFDEEISTLDDLFQAFSLQTQIDFKKERVFIFLDEIQKLPNFQNQLKIYYDLYPNLKFFISGSTSLFLKKKTQESLAGRILSFYLPPLNFKEYLYFKDKSEVLEKPLVFEREIEKEFAIFLKSQFVESIFLKDSREKKEYLISIVKKIIFEDIPQSFPVDNPEILWQLTKIIAQHPGLFINYQHLSKKIGVSNKRISAYLFYLEESFLVKKVYNFSRNLLTSEKKLKKFYLASPSLSWALSDFVNDGQLVENLVLSLSDYKFFWRDAYQHEVDFIKVQDSKIIPIEVKSKKDIEKKDLNSLIIFAKKFKTPKAIIFTGDIKPAITKLKDLQIERLPVYFV